MSEIKEIKIDANVQREILRYSGMTLAAYFTAGNISRQICGQLVDVGCGRNCLLAISSCLGTGTKIAQEFNLARHRFESLIMSSGYAYEVPYNFYKSLYEAASGSKEKTIIAAHKASKVAISSTWKEALKHDNTLNEVINQKLMEFGDFCEPDRSDYDIINDTLNSDVSMYDAIFQTFHYYSLWKMIDELKSKELSFKLDQAVEKSMLDLKYKNLLYKVCKSSEAVSRDQFITELRSL